MAKIHIFNPSSGPVVYSIDGHILGGGEHRDIDALDKHGEHCVQCGYLVVIEDAAPAKAAPKRSAAKDESGAGASDESGGN
jgi:hypothetical protein